MSGCRKGDYEMTTANNIKGQNINNDLITALYCRLSVEDIKDDKNNKRRNIDESNSISNRIRHSLAVFHLINRDFKYHEIYLGNSRSGAGFRVFRDNLEKFRVVLEHTVYNLVCFFIFSHIKRLGIQLVDFLESCAEKQLIEYQKRALTNFVPFQLFFHKSPCYSSAGASLSSAKQIPAIFTSTFVTVKPVIFWIADFTLF